MGGISDCFHYLLLSLLFYLSLVTILVRPVLPSYHRQLMKSKKDFKNQKRKNRCLHFLSYLCRGDASAPRNVTGNKLVRLLLRQSVKNEDVIRIFDVQLVVVMVLQDHERRTF